jgi:hypothetical protein
MWEPLFKGYEQNLILDSSKVRYQQQQDYLLIHYLEHPNNLSSYT